MIMKDESTIIPNFINLSQKYGEFLEIFLMHVGEIVISVERRVMEQLSAETDFPHLSLQERVKRREGGEQGRGEIKLILGQILSKIKHQLRKESTRFQGRNKLKSWILRRM